MARYDLTLFALHLLSDRSKALDLNPENGVLATPWVAGMGRICITRIVHLSLPVQWQRRDQTWRMLLPSGIDQDFSPDWLWKSTARSMNASGASTAYCT